MRNLIDKIVTPKFISRTKYVKLVLIIALALIVSFTGIVYASERPSVDVGQDDLNNDSDYGIKNQNQWNWTARLSCRLDEIKQWGSGIGIFNG